MKKLDIEDIGCKAMMIIGFTLGCLSMIWVIFLMIQGPQSENYSFSEEPYSVIGEKRCQK